MRGLFITGTDTNVGKTVAAAAVMHRYRDAILRAAPLRYWKPIQTGFRPDVNSGTDDDTAEVQRLGCAAGEVLDRGIRLPEPVSPHLAAAHAGVRIDLDELGQLTTEEPATWIVEGAGGVMVPVNESQLMTDWMRHLQLPVLAVARTTLGTINHTLLTLEALRSRQLRVAGVVMIGEPNAANRAAIEQYGRVEVLGEMPILAPLDANSLKGWACAHLDPAGRLLELLT